jgi:hypothetical protein
VQVRYDEGIAIHIDPESCAVACEGGREASAVVRYADIIIVGFQYETDARRFWDAMGERLDDKGALP